MTLALAATEFGKGPPVVVLHGLFGSARNWTAIAKRLAATHRVLAVDLRNHGSSPWAESMTYADMAGDVRALIKAHARGRATLLGHSMGGKAAMLAALCSPELVDRLIVVGIASVAYPPAFLSYVRAMQSVDLNAVARRGEVDAELRGAVSDPAVRQFLLQNLVADDHAFRWRVNLAAIERALPELSGFPSFRSHRIYSGPTLFVAGSRSHYIHAGYDDAVRRCFPKALTVCVPNAGHWVHAEQPGLFLKAVLSFFGIGRPSELDELACERRAMVA